MREQFMRAIAHKISHHTAQSIADGGDNNREPKHVGVEFDKAKQHGLGRHR